MVESPGSLMASEHTRPLTVHMLRESGREGSHHAYQNTNNNTGNDHYQELANAKEHLENRGAEKVVNHF